MKIAQVMASKGDGGLEKHFIELCNGLACKEHDVYALAHAKFKNQLTSNVNFVEIDLTKSRYNPLTIYKLFKVLKNVQPNIIHAQANKAGQLVSYLTKKLPGKKVVTIHNIKKQLNFIKKFDLSIGVSKGVTLQFPDKVPQKVVYNGIKQPCITDQKTAINLPKSLHKDKPNLLSIGRLVPAKGFDLLIEAVSDIDCNVLIAGDGPQLKNLQQQIKDKKLEEKVFLLGHRNDIDALITSVDLVVISSRKEGFSYAFSESLLLNTPIISTDVPIPNEVLAKDFISSITAEDLNSKIKYALNQLEELPNKFSPIFKFAQTELLFDKQIENTLACYEELLKK